MEQPEYEDFDFLNKVTLIGDTQVGKSALLHCFMKGKMPKISVPTIGVDFATKTIRLASGYTVKAQIWDTAGQERYRHITIGHIQRTIGALLVYDISQMTTFQSIERWVEELRRHAEPDAVIILVGNKVDLAESHPESREVNADVAREMAERNGMLFMETSAVNGQQAEEAFLRLLNEVNKNQYGGRKKPIAETYTLTAAEHKEKRWCC